MSKVFLEVRDLVKRFGRVTAVDHVSFKVAEGEVLTLLGPSGCGKTTTLRLVAGFEKPDSGDVEIQGRVVVSTSRRIQVPPEKRGLGMVFQSYAIWPHMTVFDNVAYPLVVRRTNSREIKQRVEDTLELVGLAGYGSRPALLLSGGQQQRVALARALVYSPSILLLDEPLSNLDAKLRGQMRVELKRLQERVSVTVLFVTHDQIEAMSLSTRLAVMNQGRIEQLDTPQQVYEHPATPFVEDFLGRVVRFRGTIAERAWNGLLVELDGGEGAKLRLDAADDALDVGQRVLVAIRPEDLVVEDAENGHRQNVLRCSVENVLYLGSECELVIRFGPDSYTLTVPRAVGQSLGSALSLYLPEEHLRVWADTAAGAASARGAAEAPVRVGEGA
jgi:ABC-type Fe3+/spermidine/putrescine transport system ATPase subunit